MTRDHTESNGDFERVFYDEGDSEIELTGYVGGQWKTIGFPGRLLDEDDKDNRVYATARGFSGQSMIFVVHWADSDVIDVLWSWKASVAALDEGHTDLLAAVAIEVCKRIGH